MSSQTQAKLRKTRTNDVSLVQINYLLITGKALTEAELKKTLENIARNNLENSELSGKARSLEWVAQQRDYLLRGRISGGWS